jgi:hypothetical protein
MVPLMAPVVSWARIAVAPAMKARTSTATTMAVAEMRRWQCTRIP